MSDPAVRILVDDEESGTSRTRPRWFVVTAQLLIIAFLLVFAIVYRFGDDTVRASSPTVVVDVYVTDDADSDEMKLMVHRLGAERTVLDWRVLQPSRFRQTRIPPAECDPAASIRLLVANMRDANAIIQLISEWYLRPDSAVGAIRTQRGDLESRLFSDCS